MTIDRQHRTNDAGVGALRRPAGAAWAGPAARSSKLIGRPAAALRADPTNPLTWHHAEFDNVLLLVPRSIHRAAQHVGGYAQQ